MKFNIYIFLAAIALVGCNEEDLSKVVRQSDSRIYQGDSADLLVYGEKLWNDPSIGNSGLACGTCHAGNLSFNDSFKAPYPHKVAMAEDLSGLTSIDAEQMVQFCMLNPMKAEAFPWDSKELAALTLYIEEVVQPNFIKQFK